MSAMKSVILAATLIALMGHCPSVRGQYDLVKRVIAHTNDGLVISVTVDRQQVIYGQDITLHYSIRNGGSKTIYVVHGIPQSFDIDGGTFLVQAPIPAPVGHGEYDYTFSRVGVGRVYRGRIVIPAKQYDRTDIWRIRVALGYVTNISGLNRRLVQGEDPATLRGLLDSRIVTLSVGTLSVEVIDR